MTNQSTIDKLIEMHMTSMADAFRNQMQDISMKEIPFEDRFGMIVDIEYTSRTNSRLKRLIRNAELKFVVNRKSCTRVPSFLLLLFFQLMPFI